MERTQARQGNKARRKEYIQGAERINKCKRRRRKSSSESKKKKFLMRLKKTIAIVAIGMVSRDGHS